MTDAIKHLAIVTRDNWKQFLLSGFLFALLFQVIMMTALIVRFQSFPNYVEFYNWPGNIARIIESTPSWTDIFFISVEEWLVEIGQMNYDYGTGLSIWSLNVVPGRVVVLVLMGSLVALCARLLTMRVCSAGTKRSAIAALSGGSVLVAMTNATMSWVVCCATPSWVVGLAMLGLGVSTSLALESMGPLLSFAGFSLLSLCALLLAWQNVRKYTLNTVVQHA